MIVVAGVEFDELEPLLDFEVPLDPPEPLEPPEPPMPDWLFPAAPPLESPALEPDEPPLLLELEPPDLLDDFLLAFFFAAASVEADFEVDGVITIAAPAGAAPDPPLAAPVEVVDEAPDRPEPPDAPPTVPTKASTWHLMVVFDALSSVPVSTTTTASGASETVTVRNALGGVSHKRLGEKPRCQDRNATPIVAKATTGNTAKRKSAPERPPDRAGEGDVMVVRSRAIGTPRSIVAAATCFTIAEGFADKPSSRPRMASKDTLRSEAIEARRPELMNDRTDLPLSTSSVDPERLKRRENSRKGLDAFESIGRAASGKRISLRN